MDKLAIVFAIALLIFGALNTLSTKLTFQMQAEDLTGHVVPFQKPWFGVYRMFQGMSLVMLLHFAVVLKQRSDSKKEMVADASYSEMEKDDGKKTTWRSYGVVMVPAALDLFGTVCTYVGLFYNSSSIWQMFRGAMVLFATFFSVTVLKRKLSQCRKFGIFIVTVALTIVGASNMLSTSSTATDVPVQLRLFGMGMILLGMLLQGGQVVAEELLMRDLGAPPLLVVGMEGVWGCILCWVLVFPVVGNLPGDDYGGVQESIENDLYMVKNSQQLQKVIFVYLFSVFTFNIAGMFVTYQLSAVHRTLLEASRTAVIWGVDLVIHHYMPDSSFGESWNDYSWLQLLGFIILVVGQATYGELITWGMQTSSSAKIPSPRMSPMQSPAGQLNMALEIPDEE